METIFKKEEITVIQKRSEDNISTSNPKAKLPCEKKITNVYMAKKKSVMILEDESADLQEVKKNYIALTSLNVSEEYRLPKPSELDVGHTITIEYKIHIVKKGDTLSAIDSDWKGLAKLNKVDPKKLRIGQYLLVPLEKSKQATLRKEIELEETQEVNVGDCVHLVTEVEGFKKGESVLTKINEEDKITKSDELLTVTQHGKAKTEFVAVVEEDMENPTKGKAVSDEFIVSPPLNEKEDKTKIIEFNISDKDGKPINYQIFDKTRKDRKENNTTESTEKNWKDNFEEIKDKDVKLKIKVTSPSLPDEEEIESEEVKLEKTRSFKIFLNDLDKQHKEDWNILASYELLDSEKVENLKKKYSLGKEKFELLETLKEPISFNSFPNDPCKDDVYYDNLENTSACDGKYDVNPMGSDFWGNEIKEKKEKPWTTILGFSASIDAGISGTFESGVFRSKYIDEDGKPVYVRGQYIALEVGAGATATGADASFVATTGYAEAPFQAYLEGKYNNSGGDFATGLEAGASLITTISYPVYFGITFDLGIGTPAAGGHNTVGYGEFFNVEEMVDFWTWKPWKNKKGHLSPQAPFDFINKAKKILQKFKNLIKE